ncbi:hypothetical protein ACTFIU_010588 [Dictyostelium citrinum]
MLILKKNKTTGGNETSVRVFGYKYLILNKESLEKLNKYISREKKNKNQKYERWIKEYQINPGYSNKYKVPYISGRIAPSRSFAKEPSRLLVTEKDFMIVIGYMYNDLEESDKTLTKLQKTFANSPWGWFTCNKSCKDFFDSISDKNSNNSNNNYQSEDEHSDLNISCRNNDFDSDKEDYEEDNSYDDEDDYDDEDEKVFLSDSECDSGRKESNALSLGISRNNNQKSTNIKVPPTAPKSKETQFKTPPKKRKWDDSDPEDILKFSKPTTKIVTKRLNNTNNHEKDSIPPSPIVKISPTITKIAKTTSSSTTPSITPTITAQTVDSGKILINDDNLGKNISQFEHPISLFFKTTTDLLDSLTQRLYKLEERGRKIRIGHRKTPNKIVSQSSDEDQSDDNIESCQQQQQQNEKKLKVGKEPFFNVKLSSTNISVCHHSEDHHIPLDQLEKISRLPVESVSINPFNTITDALVYGDNSLNSFIPLSRMDENGYGFVIVCINHPKTYFIGVVNFTSANLSKEIICGFNERELAFDYKTLFNIETIKAIEEKPIKDLQYFQLC